MEIGWVQWERRRVRGVCASSGRWNGMGWTEKGEQRWGICNPRQTACHSWCSQGAHTQAEEIRCQFKAGQMAKLQVSHYKTWGHLKTLGIFFLPVLLFNSLNHLCLVTPLSFWLGLVFVTQSVCAQRRHSGGCYMITLFEAYCSRHLEQHWAAFQNRDVVQAKITNRVSFTGILITNLIYPISRGRLPCKSRKVRISTLIKPSFSDDSRALKISGCYLRAVECHRHSSPPTVTLNTLIKWGWVLLSPNSFNSLVGIQVRLGCCSEMAFLQPHRKVGDSDTSPGSR